jgi:hypothetical protein
VVLIAGTVTAVTVFPEYCCITIKTRSSVNKVSVLLWSYMVQPNNEINRWLHNHYLELVRDAYTYGKQIQVGTSADTSSIAESVTIFI